MTPRTALLVAALAAAAGCSVDLEGAACEVPGATDQCPDGQRCGKDLKCSKRAAEASCAFCEVAANACSGAAAIRDCEEVPGDAVCDRWETTDCASGLVCSGADGSAACECPPTTTEVAIDPERSGEGIGAATPNGAAAPPGCRFEGLAQAREVAAATRWRVYRAAGGSTTIDLGETLLVPAGVELTTDATPADPASFTLRGDLGSSDLVHLEGGATLRGFTVQSTGATGDVLEVVCGAESGAAAGVLDGVVLDGGAHAARGLVVAGACPATATELEVRGATGDGVLVATGDAAVGLTATGVLLLDNGGVGARLTSGRLSLSATVARATVSGNTGGGVRLEGSELDATVDGLLVTANGGAGLYVNATGAVRIRGLTVAKNLGTDYGPDPQRQAGGVLLRGTAPPTFEFAGNTVCSNQGDEVGVYASTPWVIGGASGTCGNPALANRIGVPSGDSSRIVHSTSGAVDARYVWWAPSDPPSVAAAVTYEPSCDIFTLPAACL